MINDGARFYGCCVFSTMALAMMKDLGCLGWAASGRSFSALDCWAPYLGRFKASLALWTGFSAVLMCGGEGLDALMSVIFFSFVCVQQANLLGMMRCKLVVLNGVCVSI
jgi:hypothetical protein